MKHRDILDGMLESAPKLNPIFSDIKITQRPDCQNKFKFPATKVTAKAVGSAVDQIKLSRGCAGFRGIQIKHKNGAESKMFNSSNYYGSEVTIKDLAHKNIVSIGFKVH